jgi:hypothetical protein
MSEEALMVTGAKTRHQTAVQATCTMLGVLANNCVILAATAAGTGRVGTETFNAFIAGCNEAQKQINTLNATPRVEIARDMP